MKIRRVVTGLDKEGKSVVKWDSELETYTSRPGNERVELWATKSLPAEQTEEDPANWELDMNLASGSIFRIARYEPKKVAEMWHSTDTIDYGIVLTGEICMQLEKEEVILKEGDVLIQRGVNHNWVNRSDKVCVIAFILIATKDGKATPYPDKY